MKIPPCSSVNRGGFFKINKLSKSMMNQFIAMK